MTFKPRRPCGEFGCGNLTTKTYCEIHQKSVQETTRKYNRYARDPIIEAFYKSADWLRVRLLALSRDNHLCQRCLKRGHLTPAKIVHHIVEVKADWSKRLDIDNLESVCQACHNSEHKGTPR